MKSDQIVQFDSEGIKRAATLVRAGGLIGFPTDTVYGIGCDPRDERAIQRLFEVKQREGKPIPVLCDGMETAERLVRFNSVARALAKNHWPGALTLVLALKDAVPYALHQGTRELGVRVPRSASCVRLIGECGGILTGTSANVSGALPARSARAVVEQLGEGLSLILDGGTLRGVPSTVVRVTSGRIEVLREGAVRVNENGGVR